LIGRFLDPIIPYHHITISPSDDTSHSCPGTDEAEVKKVTYTLDEETVSYLNRTAERLGLSKSRVVREAIRIYGEQAGRLSTEERARLLDVFDEVTDAIPDRGRGDVERELSEIQTARREGGREMDGTPEVERGTEDEGGGDAREDEDMDCDPK
jgi:hypothetical protein